MYKNGLKILLYNLIGVLFLIGPFFCFSQNEITNEAEESLSDIFLDRASVMFTQEVYDSCIIYARYSMKESVATNSWDRWYRGFDKIAYCYYYQDDFESLIVEIEKYIEEINTYEGDSFYLAKLYGWIGFSNYYLEKSDDEMKANLKGIDIFEAINRQNEGASLYQNVGIEYTKRADYDKAISYLEIAERYAIEQDQVNDLPTIWRNMAWAYRAIDDYNKCIEVANKIIEVDGFNFSIAMILVESYIGLSDYEKSEYYLNRSREFLEDEPENYYYYYFNKGSLSNDSGGEDVEKNFQKAIDIAKHSDFITDRELARTYISLGDYYESDGNYDQAQFSYIEGLTKLDSSFTLKNLEQQNIFNDVLIGNVVWVMEALNGLAKSEKGILKNNFSHEELDKTLEYYLNCFFVIENLRLNIQTEGSKLHMSEYVNEIYEDGLNFIFEYKDDFQNESINDVILYILEKSRSYVLSSSLQEVSAKSISGIPDSLLQVEKSLLRSISEIKGIGFGDLNQRDQERLFKKERELEKLNKYFKDAYPLYAKIKIQTIVPNIATVRNDLLSDNQAMIYYFFGQENLFRFVLSKENLLWDRLDLNTVSKNLVAYKNMLTNRSFDSEPERYFAQFCNLSHTLYSSLMLGGLEKVNDEIDELIILPDGNLHMLSFESLMRSIPNGEVSYSLDHVEYLIEDYAISYANSIDLVMKQKSTEQGEFLHSFSGFAPNFAESTTKSNYRSCGDHELAELKFSKEEILSIMSITGGNACANSLDVNQNRIYFSQDEFLTTNEIYQMDIQAQMVVLSACETGLGKFATGEGVMSLARGFTFAGVPSILMSLWSIPDQSTSTIMSKYYYYLDSGMLKSKALQMAKLDFIKEASLLQQHPHFWSPIVVIGDTENISFSSSKIKWYGYLGILIFGCIIIFLVHRASIKKTD